MLRALFLALLASATCCSAVAAASTPFYADYCTTIDGDEYCPVREIWLFFAWAALAIATLIVIGLFVLVLQWFMENEAKQQQQQQR